MKGNSILILYAFVSSCIANAHAQIVPSSIPLPSSLHCEKYCFVKCDQFLNSVNRGDHHPPGIWISSMMFYFQTRNTNGNEFSECVAANRYCSCDTRFNIRNPLLWMGLVGFGFSIITFLCYLCKRCTMFNLGNVPCRRVSILDGSTLNTISCDPNAPFTDWFRGDDYEDKPPAYVDPPAYYEIYRRNSNTKSTKSTAVTLHPA